MEKTVGVRIHEGRGRQGKTGKRVRGHYDKVSRQEYEEVEEIDNGPTPKQRADAAKKQIASKRAALEKEHDLS